jgi:hypothetical protein
VIVIKELMRGNHPLGICPSIMATYLSPQTMAGLAILALEDFLGSHVKGREPWGPPTLRGKSGCFSSGSNKHDGLAAGSFVLPTRDNAR